MIPLLYDKTGSIKLGELTNCIECLVEEERNGLFEVSLIYPTNDTLFNSLEEENIIVCNANDTLLNQKFRIYMTRKLMSNKIEVFARHISFDLAYDYINNIDIKNQSCEYALNTIFRNSQFSTHYRGYSDIINAQNYKISKVNCIEAIGGKEGSILDTFGTGAEILRDNTNIHILNKRGYDNGVSIEYAKNLTGFELEEDYSELITRIIPFASYTDNESNKEILIEANAVDSELISNYSHPYINYMDFSDKFEDEEVPTASKLTNLAKEYFKNNNCDKPKQNFKIEFIPLSKCVGYEGIQDNISLCDTVTIKDTRFNIDTKAKVIKTVFNVLGNKYEGMELGEPRTTLGDIISSNSGGQDGEQGPPGPQGPPGEDGNIGDFPNSLPATPVLSAKVYGFASIELNWTYENKVYYNYELYGSKTKDFIPNTFDLIHAGQTSSYLFQAKPNETWYFRVCAINTHGERTSFSDQITVNTTKIDDMSNYFESVAIGNAVVGVLTSDYMEAGTIKGNYIDARNLTVTDGNGKRTLDIDSYGNVNLNVSSLKVSSESVATKTDLNGKIDTNKVISSINQTAESVKIKANKIQLDGATTVGDSASQYVTIDKGNYSLRNSTRENGFFGFKSFEGYTVPRLLMGMYGIEKGVHNYGGVSCYPGTNNPESNTSAYMDINYHCYNKNDYSNVKMYSNGDIKLAPIRDLTITTNYSNGADLGAGYERPLGVFTTDGTTLYNSVLEINAIANKESGKGLILSDRFYDAGWDGYGQNKGSDYRTALQIQTASTGVKYVRPESNGDVRLGSTSNRFYRLYATESCDTSSDRRLKENIKYIESVPNSKADTTSEITIRDMYNFVKDDLYLTMYNFKGKSSVKYGFMAQDIVNTKVGINIINNERSEDDTENYMSYDTMNYTNALAGALKEAINEIEKLKKEINILKANS